MEIKVASNIDYDLLGLSKPSSSPIDRSSLGIPSSRGKGPAPAGWVADLQRALLTEAKKINLNIDLGAAGIDGRYGPKTRQAVEDFAAARNIQNPLDSSGRPTAEVNKALGISGPPASSAPPPPAATPSKPVDSAAKPEASDRPPLLQFKLLDGTEFNMLNFSRGLHKGGLTLDNEPWEATQALAQMRYALTGGGIKLEAQLPQTKMLSISTTDQYNTYMQSIDAVVAEIVEKCNLIARSFLAEVNKKRKELGMKEVTRPSTQGSPEEVYGFEESFWNGALAGGSIALSAQRILSEKLLSFFRGSKKKVFDLLKATVDVNPIFKGDSLTEESAKKIGEAIANTRTEFAKQIDEQDSSFYYDLNKDLPGLRHRVNESLAAIGEPRIRQMLMEK
jgi:peptidoglycan hydrolase-like protein with peptidoglycan-binding domain